MTSSPPCVGVLALQGAFERHLAHLRETGLTCKAIIKKKDLAQCAGLIIPGGESTTMFKLIQYQGIDEALRTFATTNPVWGVCAGAILLARQALSPPTPTLGCIGVDIRRNAYGRQIDSYTRSIHGHPVSFIRAPIIERIDPDIKVLHWEQTNPSWVEKGGIMLTTFHPELSTLMPSPWHKRFAERIQASLKCLQKHFDPTLKTRVQEASKDIDKVNSPTD